MAKLREIRLRNFRSFTDAAIPFRSRTILIGSNNSGKTSILEALDKVVGIGSRRGYGFLESDLRIGAATGEVINVEIDLVPDDGSVFAQYDTELFETHIDNNGSSEIVTIATESGYDPEGLFRTRGYFKKTDGHEDGPIDSAVRESIAFFYLPSVRDARFELDERAGLWSRLVTLLEAAADAESLSELSFEAGSKLLAAVLGEERSRTISEAITGFMSEVLYVDDDATSAALAPAAVDHKALLRRADLLVSVPGDVAATPVRQQSTGLQTLSMFGLFTAYLESHSRTVLAVGLEEPEAHLAPHAARSLVSKASEASQTVFTTHSPVIADSADIEDFVIIHKTKNGARATSVPKGTFDSKELGLL